MSTKTRLLKESSFLFGGQIYFMASNVLLMMLLARILTVEDFGKFIFAQSIVNTIIIFSALGLHRTITQFTAIHLANNEWGKVKGVLFRLGSLTVLFSVVLGGLLSFISYCYGDRIYKHADIGFAVAILALTYPLRAIVASVCAFFQGTGKMLYPAILQSVSDPSLRILLALSLCLSSTVVLRDWVYGLLAVFGLNCLLAIWIFFRYSPQIIHGEKTEQIDYRKSFAFATPLLLNNLVILGINYSDVIFLGYFGIPQEVGVYKVYKIMGSMILGAISALAVTYHPNIIKLIAADKPKESQELYSFICKMFQYIGICGFAIMVIFGGEIGTLLFGTDFSLQKPMLILILACGPLMNCLSGPNGMTLQAIGRTKLIMLNSILALFVLLLSSYLLIPLYGMTGAAFATLACYVIIHAAGAIELYLLKGYHPLPRTSIKYIVLSLLLLSPVIITQYIGMYTMSNLTTITMKLTTCAALFILTYSSLPAHLKRLIVDWSRPRR